MKYIIFENEGMIIPIVFSEFMNFSLISCIGTPISAGFCDINEVGLITIDLNHRSEELELSPSDKDVFYLNAFINNLDREYFKRKNNNKIIDKIKSMMKKQQKKWS